jgi:hypothetical protein
LAIFKNCIVSGYYAFATQYLLSVIPQEAFTRSGEYSGEAGHLLLGFLFDTPV